MPSAIPTTLRMMRSSELALDEVGRSLTDNGARLLRTVHSTACEDVGPGGASIFD